APRPAAGDTAAIVLRPPCPPVAWPGPDCHGAELSAVIPSARHEPTPHAPEGTPPCRRRRCAAPRRSAPPGTSAAVPPARSATPPPALVGTPCRGPARTGPHGNLRPAGVAARGGRRSSAPPPLGHGASPSSSPQKFRGPACSSVPAVPCLRGSG